MAITVNTNLSSLGAQLNLNNSSQMLNQSLQRLSSGLRINSAKDDAAGMAISQTLSSAIRGNNVAIRNANDGVSVGQTAEGALGRIADNLQRIREIAVQASSSGVSDDNRAQLQREVNQLTQEISRNIQTTEFNGTKLLQGGANLTFQVGSKGADTNQISIQTVDLSTTNKLSTDEYTALSKAAADFAGDSSKQAAFSKVLDNVSLKLSKDDKDNLDKLTKAYLAAPSGDATTGAALTAAIAKLDPSKAPAGFLNAADHKALSDLVTTASGDKSKWGDVDTKLAGFTGLDATAKTNFTNAMTAFKTEQAKATPDATAMADLQGKMNAALAGFKAPAATNLLNSYSGDLTHTKTIDVTSQAGASAVLTALDADISKISDIRSTFGSVMNRFDAVVANLSNYTQNLTAANSRIMDVDFASETANLTKNQILQQAGGAILKQSNSLPQAALSLLQ